MEFKPRNCRRWWRYICSERKQQVFDHSWRCRRSQHPGCDTSINITGNGGNNSSLGSGGSLVFDLAFVWPRLLIINRIFYL